MSDKKSMQEVEVKRQEWLRNVGQRHFTNMLDEMMAMQKKFGGMFIDFDKLKLEEKERWTKEMVLAMMDELSEVLGQINWKHWKNEQPVDEMEVKYELIDLWHFLMNLMLVWGMKPEDVFSMYIAKNRENYKRQESKY